MKKRKHYTIGFNISLGSLFGSLKDQLMQLAGRVESMSLKHHFLESIDIIFGKELVENSNKDIEPNLKEIEKIQKIINSFNESIKILNKRLLDEMGFFPNLPILQSIEQEVFLSQLNQRFLKKYKDEEPQKLADELLALKIFSCLEKAIQSILDIERFFLNLTKEIKIDTSEKYANGFEEAKAILSIGCSETAVFVVGRTIETLINDLLINEINKSNIQKIDLKKISLEDKIGKLKGINIIEEKEFHILQKLKFDRNDFGHPFDKEISFDEAKRIILDASNLTKILEKKMEIKEKNGKEKR